LDASEALRWIESEEGLAVRKRAFESTSRFARLVSVKGAMWSRIQMVL
jgi:hydroxymethylglutaryl-CoA reductase